MQCPQCQHQNPTGMKFCGECAAPLASTCPSCGAANPHENKFCGQCAAPLRTNPTAKFAAPDSYTPKYLAERILTSKAALEGERKQVTVLFADLKGSMELLADRDPEEARKLLDPVLEHMMEAVHRYEGTVNQVMGDGIMALFGAPLAHEDHAIRACYAALRMQESVKGYAEEIFRSKGVLIQIRAGLNSGEVVVRAIGSDLRVDYTAIGQTTHLAARMEQLVDPGTIFLAPPTLPLVEGYVELEARGAVAVKGLKEPIEVSELVGALPVRSRLQATASRGLTQFVARESETEQLRLALERARTGHGQVVGVVGEPGVGKSRLYWEFANSHHTQGCLVLESHAVSYGKATSYLLVIDLMKAYFHIEAHDEPGRIRDKVTNKLLSLDETLRPAIVTFLALLDLPVDDPAWRALDPPQRRQRTFDAVKRLLLQESERQPLLVVCEDLHWIDSETQGVLDSLVQSVPTARLLLLVNYRPEYQHRWSSKTYYIQLRIDPLPPESAERFLGTFLGADPGLEQLMTLLIERTDGNPFFLEESVRGLVETGTLRGTRGAYRLATSSPSIRIPETVQAVVAARIDRLPPDEKRLLQSAAVIGKDVPFALLHAIADLPELELRQSVENVQAREFVYERTLFPDLEYTFKHALTHEVAYGGVLQERRRTLHARLVVAIEQLYAGRLAEQVERLAHHAFSGELWEHAVAYSRQSGAKAAARSALRDAATWFEQALATLQGMPETGSTLEQAVDIRLEFRPVMLQLGQIRQGLARLEEAEAIAERLSDDRRLGRVCAVMTNLLNLLGESNKAIAAGTRALSIAQRLGDASIRHAATSYLAQQYINRGEFQRAGELAAGNLATLPLGAAEERFGGMGAPISVTDRTWLATSLWMGGKFQEASEFVEEGIGIAERTEHPFTVSFSYATKGYLSGFRGDWAVARSALEHALRVAHAGNVVVLRSVELAGYGWALAYLGEVAEAANCLQEVGRLEEVRRTLGMPSGTAGPIDFWLGESYLALGRLAEAQRSAEGLLEATHIGYARPLGLYLHAQIEKHRDRSEKSQDYYRQALVLFEERSMRPLIAHCHLGLGKLYRRSGKRQKAQEHLATATTMYRDMGMTYWLEQAEANMMELK